MLHPLVHPLLRARVEQLEADAARELPRHRRLRDALGDRHSTLLVLPKHGEGLYIKFHFQV